MDFNTTIDLIKKELDGAIEIIEDLKKYPDAPLPQIELAKSKCKSAAEVISLLKSLQDNSEENTVIETVELKEIKPEADKTLSSPPPDIKQETESEDTIPSANHTQTDSDTTKKETIKKTESTIIADRFGHLSSRINDKLADRQKPDDVTDILKSKQLSNLSGAIGINDRFVFIREIFNNNSQNYNKAISELESVKSIDDASSIISKYGSDKSDKKTVSQLLDLVKRKLKPNE